MRKYTVEVRNLPPYFHDRYRLAQWFAARFGKVVDVALAFEQHDLLDVYRARGRLRKDIDMAVAHGETGRLDGMYDALQRIDARIDEIQKDLLDRKTLGAYVTFEFQESRIACEKAFSNLWLRSIAGKVVAGAAGAGSKSHSSPLRTSPAMVAVMPAGGRSAAAAAAANNAARIDVAGFGSGLGAGAGASAADPHKTLLFGESQRILYVAQAPEPSNIIFRNLKYSPRNKLARKAITGLATAILLLVSVVVVYVAQRFGDSSGGASRTTCPASISVQQAQADQSGTLRDCFCYHLSTSAALNSARDYGVDCTSWLTSVAIARALSVLAVVTICVVNFLLKVFVKGLTQFEKHHSVTRMQESITNKLFVGLFLNTGVVLLVVNMQVKSSAANIGFSLAFDGKYADLVYECESQHTHTHTEASA